MIAFAKQVLEQKAKLMKTNSLLQLDKAYQFSIFTIYGTYDEATRSTTETSILEQNIDSNRLDYVLQRYYDWINYRTNWFMG